MANNFEGQLDKIREEHYEKTKELTNEELARSINENGRRIAQQHGIKVVSASEVRGR